MQINTISADLGFEKANRYLPVRLSTTYFDEIGECMCIVANRADGMTTDIIENDDSKVLIDYDVSNNPAVPSFTLHFSFRDDMDQEQMYEQICIGVGEKMRQIFGVNNNYEF